MDCQALFAFNQVWFFFFVALHLVVSGDRSLSFPLQFSGMASVGFSSINLSIRTYVLLSPLTLFGCRSLTFLAFNHRMAVWLHNKYIVALLVVIILGHWSLILQGRARG
jgi:hypothetical protein